MKKLLILLLLLPFSVYSSPIKDQTFNNYSGSLKVQTVNYDYHIVTFSGTVEIPGELVFELRHGDGYSDEIYEISFIPKDSEILPYVASGFYPKKLNKLSILNHSDAKGLVFTDSEWESILKRKEEFVSRFGIIKIVNYATSVECDSRQYYANIDGFEAPENEIAYFKVRDDVVGC